MKHTGPIALEALLPRLRGISRVRKKTRGVLPEVWAFLHFHEDPASLNVDISLKVDSDEGKNQLDVRVRETAR